MASGIIVNCVFSIDIEAVNVMKWHRLHNTAVPQHSIIPSTHPTSTYTYRPQLCTIQEFLPQNDSYKLSYGKAMENKINYHPIIIITECIVCQGQLFPAKMDDWALTPFLFFLMGKQDRNGQERRFDLRGLYLPLLYPALQGKANWTP
ncbi:hypothetical protein NPIL_40251 [Nephila pilipes]|uniref:Uncharacterized protein n=1 Tax=Nephila pilipes TaxID=299642 RepID=A0A8X6PYT0_NEPPI|nr:hypothetical protein NPIL_40251 [Nephila pilipes]